MSDKFTNRPEILINQEIDENDTLELQGTKKIISAKKRDLDKEKKQKIFSLPKVWIRALQLYSAKENKTESELMLKMLKRYVPKQYYEEAFQEEMHI